MPMVIPIHDAREGALTQRASDTSTPLSPWGKQFTSHRLKRIAERQARQRVKYVAAEEDFRTYAAPLMDVFIRAAKDCRRISIDPDVMAGAPCLSGTRIPVYGILDALQHHGTLKGVLRSYPRLSKQQVEDAITFAKLVVECPLED